MDFPVSFNPELNTSTVGSTNMVFHCHYYNCAVQKVIEDTIGDMAPSLFQESAFKAAHPQLATLLTSQDSLDTRINKGLALFQQLGFGSFDTSKLTKTGGVVVSNSSHYALGWLSEYGEREHPVCQFIEGYLKALILVAFELEAKQITVEEVECMAVGAEECRFNIEIK